jgi:hypothetical protein
MTRKVRQDGLEKDSKGTGRRYRRTRGKKGRGMIILMIKERVQKEMK